MEARMTITGSGTLSLQWENNISAPAQRELPGAWLKPLGGSNMTQTIPLTQGQVALVDDDDFGWLSKFRWYAHWAPSTQSFYAERHIPTGLTSPSQRTLLMHRVIWEHHNGPIPVGLTTDHIDRTSLNDRRSNLRLATRSQQKQNQGLYGNNTSGFRGVHFLKNSDKWTAYITIDKERIHLGTYASPADAARAYDEAALAYYDPTFAQLNFPQ
jgi:hypothetical protein